MGLISICIPCMNRLPDMKMSLPNNIGAANASPPVEIVILDYNSKDELSCYIDQVRKDAPIGDGNSLRYFRYTKPEYYHNAHARNLVSILAKGDYLVELGSDASLNEESIKTVRRFIKDYQCEFMYPFGIEGIMVVKRDEFIKAGGYDERMELYGAEDKDLSYRLIRRGLKHGELPANFVKINYTKRINKVKNYRLPEMSWKEMAAVNYVYLRENIANNAMVANEGKEWGQWD